MIFTDKCTTLNLHYASLHNLKCVLYLLKSQLNKSSLDVSSQAACQRRTDGHYFWRWWTGCLHHLTTCCPDCQHLVWLEVDRAQFASQVIIIYHIVQKHFQLYLAISPVNLMSLLLPANSYQTGRCYLSPYSPHFQITSLSLTVELKR